MPVAKPITAEEIAKLIADMKAGIKDIEDALGEFQESELPKVTALYVEAAKDVPGVLSDFAHDVRKKVRMKRSRK